MTDTVELARRDGVELVKTGSWSTMTGTWNPTPDDLAAAVEAQQCPAIRKPVVKLGHVDKRFDGEPSMGWFENLRLADGGKTLVGDQVSLPWLHKVQAAAYPSRSIEGNFNHTCAQGHKHRFVVTAVALLGVTPPAVTTIRNLNDLPAALGVAAADQGIPEGAKPVQVTIMAADGDTEHTGGMVALIPTEEDAQRLAVDGGEDADELHVTLAYLGEAADLGDAGQQDVIDAVSTAVNGLSQVRGDVFSAAVFNPGGGEDGDRKPCLVYLLGGDMLAAVHDLIAEALLDVPVPAQHLPWHAHMTAAYTGDLQRIADLTAQVGPVVFDRLRIAFAGQYLDIPLIGEPEPLPDDGGDADVSAADGGGDDNELKRYWLYGEGLRRWAGARHPWTTLYRLILKHVRNPEKAKRITSDWYREHFGHMPNQKPVKAAAEAVLAAWNAAGVTDTQWVQEARPDAVVVVDDTTGGRLLYPAEADGDTVTFGEPAPYTAAAGEVLVFASRADVMAHLRGHHDQSTHGNRFHTPGDRSSGLRHHGKERSSTGGGKGGRAAKRTYTGTAAEQARDRVFDRGGKPKDLKSAADQESRKVAKAAGLPTDQQRARLHSKTNGSDAARAAMDVDLAAQRVGRARALRDNTVAQEKAARDVLDKDGEDLTPEVRKVLQQAVDRAPQVRKKNEDSLTAAEKDLAAARKKWDTARAEVERAETAEKNKAAEKAAADKANRIDNSADALKAIGHRHAENAAETERSGRVRAIRTDELGVSRRAVNNLERSGLVERVHSVRGFDQVRLTEKGQAKLAADRGDTVHADLTRQIGKAREDVATFEREAAEAGKRGGPFSSQLAHAIRQQARQTEAHIARLESDRAKRHTADGANTMTPAERDAAAYAAVKSADAAILDRDRPTALAAIDKGEALHPDYRIDTGDGVPVGWAQLRKVVIERTPEEGKADRTARLKRTQAELKTRLNAERQAKLDALPQTHPDLQKRILAYSPIISQNVKGMPLKARQTASGGSINIPYGRMDANGDVFDPEGRLIGRYKQGVSQPGPGAAGWVTLETNVPAAMRTPGHEHRDIKVWRPAGVYQNLDDGGTITRDEAARRMFGTGKKATPADSPARDPQADAAQYKEVQDRFDNEVKLADLIKRGSRAAAAARREHGLPTASEAARMSRSRDRDEAARGKAAAKVADAANELERVRVAQENNKAQIAWADRVVSDGNLRPANVERFQAARAALEKKVAEQDDMIAERERKLADAVREWRAGPKAPDLPKQPQQPTVVKSLAEQRADRQREQDAFFERLRKGKEQAAQAEAARGKGKAAQAETQARSKLREATEGIESDTGVQIASERILEAAREIDAAAGDPDRLARAMEDAKEATRIFNVMRAAALKRNAEQDKGLETTNDAVKKLGGVDLRDEADVQRVAKQFGLTAFNVFHDGQGGFSAAFRARGQNGVERVLTYDSKRGWTSRGQKVSDPEAVALHLALGNQEPDTWKRLSLVGQTLELAGEARERRKRHAGKKPGVAAAAEAAIFSDLLGFSEPGFFSPILPAAEPEHEINSDPKEDLVSDDLIDISSRLGLPDDADLADITAEIDALKAQASKAVTPEMVAASAAVAAEADELRKEVTVLASRMEQVTAELAAAKAEKAATVKASVLDAAVKDGKIAPADRGQWETDYDEAPTAITRVLASIAPGTAVPVVAAGVAGSPDPGGSDSEWDEIVSRIDAPKVA